MAAIVAGESSVKLVDCTAKCGSYVVLNHVVGGGPGDGIFTQVSDISIIGGSYQCEEPAIICKSCNADVLLEGTKISSAAGVLLKSRINDDPCAPDPTGRDVYGIHAMIRNMEAQGSILHEDPKRRMTVKLEGASLTGAVTGGVLLSLDAGSHWTATADSQVVIHGDISKEQIDAVAGVTIHAIGAENMTCPLPSGGILEVKEQ